MSGAAILLRRITGSPIVADDDWAATQVVPDVASVALGRRTDTLAIFARAYDNGNALLSGDIVVQPIMYGSTIAAGVVEGTFVGGGATLTLTTAVPELIDVRGVDEFTVRFVSTALAAETIELYFILMD